LKEVLVDSLSSKDFEVYFYSLGLIPTLVQTYPLQAKAFSEQDYIALLTRHM
jgi:hypothetical protein